MHVYLTRHKKNKCQILKWYYHIIPCKKRWAFNDSHNVSQQASEAPQNTFFHKSAMGRNFLEVKNTSNIKHI